MRLDLYLPKLRRPSIAQSISGCRLTFEKSIVQYCNGTIEIGVNIKYCINENGGDEGDREARKMITNKIS